MAHGFDGDLQRQRHCEAEHFRGLQIDHPFKLDWHLNWKLRWLCTMENAIDVRGGPSDTDFLAWMAGHPKGPAFQHWHWEWLPTIDFPWRITAGTLVTAAVALIFRTPPDHRNAAGLPHAAQSFYLSPPTILSAPRSPLKSP